MTNKEQCSLCKYILAKSTCGCSASPYFGRTVDACDHCDSFALSLGAEAHMNGILKCLETGSNASGIPHFEEALKYGLLVEDEISVRFALAQGYLEVVGNSALPSAEMAKMPEMGRAFEELENAAAIDRKKGYGYFEEKLNRSRLLKSNFLYCLVADAITEEKGPEAGLAFIDQKLEVFRYLSSTPMIYLIEYQSKLYLKCGKQEAAKECLKTILAASPLDSVDENGKEMAFRQRVSSTLRSLESSGEIANSIVLSPKSPLAAKVGLTLAIVGLFFGGIVFGPIAMFLGFQALSEITKAETTKGKGLAVSALIVGGLVTLSAVISIFKVLARH